MNISGNLFSKGITKLLVPVSLMIMNTAAMAEGIDIVVNGEARAVIVLPDSASPVVQYAAEELQSHIELATGARIGIVREARASKDAPRIYVGPCKEAVTAGIRAEELPKNTSFRKSTTDALFLAGNDGSGNGIPPREDFEGMGSLFAVYDWLEAQLNVRWLWPGKDGTVITETKNLSGGALGEHTVHPPLLHSRLRIGGGRRETPPDKFERFLRENDAWLRRHRFARVVSLEYGHGFEKYWEQYGKAHPEYFALRPDGKREPADMKATKLVQMCVSNPGLHKQVVENWLKQREEDPTKPWINGIENDRRVTDPHCGCEGCLAWDGKSAGTVEDGEWLVGAEEAKKSMTPAGATVSLSNRYARFWLALQEEAKKHDPEATVFGYAYAAYAKPPEGIQLNDSIIVGIVPPYSFPLDEKDRQAFHQLWDGWGKTGARRILRPNYFLTGYCVPYIFADEFGSEFQHASRNGLIGTDFDSLTSMWGVQGPNAYMAARLNVHPDADRAQILNDFYSGFGPASEQIRSYFDYWRQVTKKRDGEFVKSHKGGWAMISACGDEIYTPETFEEGHRLLDAARMAARGSDGAARRVEFLSTWLTHAEISMKALGAYRASLAAPADASLKRAFKEAKQAVDDYRRDNEEAFSAANMALLRKLEIWSGWRKSSEAKVP